MAKYKIKTHSGAKRRFYISGRGKLLMRKCHINNSRRKKRGATLRQFPRYARRVRGRPTPANQ